MYCQRKRARNGENDVAGTEICLSGASFLLPDDVDSLLDGFCVEASDISALLAVRDDDNYRQIPVIAAEPPLSTSSETVLESAECSEITEELRRWAPGDPLRCVDDSHRPDCIRCTPAPGPALEGSYELAGEPGKKNGEKRLRHFLTRTPEWQSAESRERLADACADDDALGPLATALRNKSCSALRKGHLLFMVRSWGYKSDLWVPRGRGKGAPAVVSATQVSAPAATVKAEAIPLVSPQHPLADHTAEKSKLQEYIATTLRPMALEAARCNAGVAASEAVWRHGGPHITEAAAKEVIRVAQFAHGVASQWRKQKECVGSRLEELAQSPVEAETPAFLTCLGKQTPTERLLYEMLEYMHSASTFNASLPVALGASITPAEDAWVKEMGMGRATALQLASRALAVISDARLGTLQSCLQTFSQLLDVLIMWTTSAAVAMEQREGWMRAYMRVFGPGQRQLLIFSVPYLTEKESQTWLVARTKPSPLQQQQEQQLQEQQLLLQHHAIKPCSLSLTGV